MNTQRMHDCGGTILTSTEHGWHYDYCDKCHAFRYGVRLAGIPNGTDHKANRAAWDAGESQSPDAGENGGAL